MPGVVGCVDGTHVRITRPFEHEKAYVNRKNYHSINVQVMLFFLFGYPQIVVFILFFLREFVMLIIVSYLLTQPSREVAMIQLYSREAL